MSLDYAALWGETLAALKLQTAPATFDQQLRNTTIHAVDGPCWQIAAPNQYALDWLDLRLRPLVERALAGVTGGPVEVEFVLPGNGASPKPDAPPPPPRDDPAPAPSNGFNLDFVQLWYGDATGGYDRMMKYWSRFWRGYLNSLNSRAYDLWEYLLVADSDKQDTSPYWTPSRPYQARALARVLGCGAATLTGGFRQCSACDRANLIGEPLEACCDNYRPRQWRLNQHGEQQCRFWREGAMEALYREGLLAIRISGDSPKNTFYHLQTWRLLPLLAPQQVLRLPAGEQQAHEQWISDKADFKKRYASSAWARYAAGRMVDDLPHREAGRDHWGVYQPNPLAGELGSADERTYDEKVRVLDSLSPIDEDED